MTLSSSKRNNYAKLRVGYTQNVTAFLSFQTLFYIYIYIRLQNIYIKGPYMRVRGTKFSPIRTLICRSKRNLLLPPLKAVQDAGERRKSGYTLKRNRKNAEKGSRL